MQNSDDATADKETKEQADQKEQEEKKKFLHQKERLKTMLLIPSQLRSEQTCREIADIVKGIKFLFQYRQKPEFQDICKHLYMKTYDKNQYIFKQGDQAEAFFIILNGSMRILIEEPTEFKNFMQQKEIGKLSNGDAFGEIALLYNSKRTASIMAQEKSDLIILEKNIFQQYIKEFKSLSLNKMLIFLEQLPVFSMFTQDILIQLSTKCTNKFFPSGTIILKQGTETTQMYIIRSGRVKAVKQVQWDGSSPQSHNPQSQTNYVEIDECGDGEVFGDYALMNDTELECSYITAIPCELIILSGFNVRKLISNEQQELYKKSLKKYPDDYELQQIYNEKKIWSNYRKKLMNNILIDKSNKNGFDSRLRLPQLIPKLLKTPINIIDIKSSDNRIYFKHIQAKISNQTESKKKVNQISRITDGKQQGMGNLLEQLSQLNLDQNISNSFQKQLKKLNLAPSAKKQETV